MRLRAKIAGLARGMDGEYLLTISTPLRAVEEVWNTLRGEDVAVDVKKWRNRRSMDANAYAWVLIDRLSEALNRDKLEVYREAIRGIGGVSDVVMVSDRAVTQLVQGWAHNGAGWFAETMPSRQPGVTTVVLYYGSSVYDTKQMSALIDHLAQDCRVVGIDPTPPYVIAGWEEVAPKGGGARGLSEAGAS